MHGDASPGKNKESDHLLVTRVVVVLVYAILSEISIAIRLEDGNCQLSNFFLCLNVQQRFSDPVSQSTTHHLRKYYVTSGTYINVSGVNE